MSVETRDAIVTGGLVLEHTASRARGQYICFIRFPRSVNGHVA
jgi:hypothetical protein